MPPCRMWQLPWYYQRRYTRLWTALWSKLCTTWLLLSRIYHKAFNRSLKSSGLCSMSNTGAARSLKCFLLFFSQGPVSFQYVMTPRMLLTSKFPSLLCLFRYLLAEGEDTLYVAFMGTKVKGDLITNARIYQELLWGEQHLGKVSAGMNHRSDTTLPLQLASCTSYFVNWPCHSKHIQNESITFAR